MTLREEIACAILIWKNYRQQNATKRNNHFPSHLSEKAAAESVEMAKACGVKDEFFRLLLKFPIMVIAIEELEEWEMSLGIEDTQTDCSQLDTPPESECGSKKKSSLPRKDVYKRLKRPEK